jgi:hypothetical protein
MASSSDTTGLSRRPILVNLFGFVMYIIPQSCPSRRFSTGIGATLARDLAREGARLVVSEIADCTQTVGAIEREGGEAIGVKADITNNGELEDLMRAAEKRLVPTQRSAWAAAPTIGACPVGCTRTATLVASGGSDDTDT